MMGVGVETQTNAARAILELLPAIRGGLRPWTTADRLLAGGRRYVQGRKA